MRNSRVDLLTPPFSDAILGRVMVAVREKWSRMSRARRVVSIAAVGCAVLAISGCGGASSKTVGLPGLEDGRNPAANVVRVAGAGGVTASALNHWIAVVAATAYTSRPSRSVPPGVVPDPPGYRKCITHLRAEPSGLNRQTPGNRRAKPTDASLKKECEAQYKVLRQSVLMMLTSFQWLAGESARQGVQISDAAVRKELERSRKEEFSTTAAFQAYLRNTGQTYEDQLLRTRIDLYSNELVRMAGKRAHANSQRADIEAYLKTAGAIARRWAAKTTCAPGYVTQDCANYRGALEPEVRS